MHKLLLNRVSVSFDLAPLTGFLVKAGDKGASLLDPLTPDMGALRATVDGRTTIFLPGSTLKGVFRSAAERTLRGLGADAARLACDPHSRTSACRERHPTAQEIHRNQCLACRLFGSQMSGGRVQFTDALPAPGSFDEAHDVSTRAGVAIDRQTGGPSRGKLYNLEVVTGGRFPELVVLENFQLWQLGLLGMLLEEVQAGLVRIGSARTRGLGAFRVKELRVNWYQPGGHPSPRGVAALRPDLAGPYGWLDGDDAPLAVPEGSRPGRWSWAGEPAWEVLRAAGDHAWPALQRWAEGR